MKNKHRVMIVSVLTVIGTFVAQTELVGTKYRTHQHIEYPSIEDTIPDIEKAIIEDEISQTHYNSNAIDINKLKTHLPLVKIETAEDIPGVPYYDEGSSHRKYTTTSDGATVLPATMQIIDNHNTYNTVNDAPAVSSNITIRVRGNTSRWFEKNSYAVTTVDGNGDEQNRMIMGMESAHDWVLHGPFLDKTLMRNYMAMNFSGEIMDYAPDVRFCEVLLNNEYRGVYVMMETVSRGEGRVNIEKPNLTKNVTGYIIEIDNATTRPVSSLNNFTKYVSVLRKDSFFDLVYPGEETITLALKDYIERDVSKFEKALYSFDYDTLANGFHNYIDMEEFADYFILMEVFLQHDTGNLSTYFYKDVNGKFKPCVWDFNNDLENISTVNDDDFFIRQFVTVQAPWFWMMIKDESYINLIISRYHEFRKGILSDENVLQYIQDVIDYLGEAVDRNYAVWAHTFNPDSVDFRNKLHPDERNPANYEEAIKQMTDELIGRLAWLDENIEVLKQYCHESAVKKFNH